MSGLVYHIYSWGVLSHLVTACWVSAGMIVLHSWWFTLLWLSSQLLTYLIIHLSCFHFALASPLQCVCSALFGLGSASLYPDLRLDCMSVTSLLCCVVFALCLAWLINFCTLAPALFAWLPFILFFPACLLDIRLVSLPCRMTYCRPSCLQRMWFHYRNGNWVLTQKSRDNHPNKLVFSARHSRRV